MRLMLVGTVDRKRGGFDDVILNHKLEVFDVIDTDENDEELPIAIKLNGRKIWLFNSEYVLLNNI